MENLPSFRRAFLALSAGAILAFVAVMPPSGALAQFAGGGGSTGIELKVADWVPERDKSYGGWGVVATGGSIETPLQWTRDAPSLNLDPGTYDVYWTQDYDNRERPILIAGGVKVEADNLVTVNVDTGLRIDVADWVPARDKSYGLWSAVKAGGEPGKPVNATNTADALVLPAGDYDVYWIQDYATRDRPLLIASGVKLEAGKLAKVSADSGIKIEVADFVPPRDKDYGWWGATARGDEPDKRINWTNAADALLLPPGDYDVYWVQDYATRDAPLLLAESVLVEPGATTTVKANSGIKIAVADWVPPRDKDYGWWGATRAGDSTDHRVNWTNTAEALLLPPGDYDVYWVQNYAGRDNPVLVAGKVHVNAEFSGVGLELEAAGDAFNVVQAVKGSPAEKAGIKADDTLVSVDGTAVKGSTLSETVARIRGSASATVKLGVLHPHGDTPVEIAVERAVIVATTTVRVSTGMRPVVASDVPTLDEKSGVWGASYAWGGPDEMVARSEGKPDPIVVPVGRYDVFWRPDSASDPLLKARNVEVRFGELVDVPIGKENLVPRVSVIADFQLTGDGSPMSNGMFAAGVKQIQAAYSWKDADIGHKLGVRWFKDDKQILEQGEPVAAKEGETKWHLKTTDGKPLPAGSYRVDLMENGELRAPLEFTIAEKKAALEPIEPAPEPQKEAAAPPATEPQKEAAAPAAPAATAPAADSGGGTGGEWVIVRAVTEGKDPTVSDDFSDPKSGWNTADAGVRHIGYVNGAFHIALDEVGAGWVFGSDITMVGNGIVAIDATDKPGTAGHPFGVFVRGQDDRNFHAFVIGSDESYAAFHVDKGEFAMDGLPDKHLPAGLYKKDGPNRITVFLNGDSIVYFLNNVEIDRAVARWPNGAAGVVSANIRPGKTDVAFDDWKVWQSPESAASGAN